MRFFKKNRKPETIVKTEEYIETPPVNVPPMPAVGRPKKEPCELCKLLSAQGRTGEISGTFVDGDPYTVEIMNQKGVEGKECYTLFLQNDSAIGFNEMPINFCPKCGCKLGARKR